MSIKRLCIRLLLSVAVVATPPQVLAQSDLQVALANLRQGIMGSSTPSQGAGPSHTQQGEATSNPRSSEDQTLEAGLLVGVMALLLVLGRRRRLPTLNSVTPDMLKSGFDPSIR